MAAAAEKPPLRPSKLDPFKPVIDEILRADLDASRKQRHTVKRIFARLIDEHGMVDVSYQVVRAYVAARKPEIRAEAGRLTWSPSLMHGLHLTPREAVASTAGDHMDERLWKVGELADATGLTVRTLHHFDEVGLLQPATRSQAGHRLYTAGDVRRLYRIIALRHLGIPLREIAKALDGNVDDLELAIRGQLEHVDQVITLQHQVRRRLAALRQTIRQAQEPAIDQLIDTMEAIMQANYFTPEQLARARQRHHEPGFAEQFTHWQAQCAHLVDEIKAEIQRGTDPADPAAQAIARQWNEVMQEMTDGDRHILSAIYAKIDGKGPEATTHGVLDAEAWDYLKRAFAVGYNHHQ